MFALSDIDTGEIVAMELNPPSSAPLLAVDAHDTAPILPRSQKRARGDDDDEIIASRVFTRKSLSNGPDETEFNDQIIHLQRRLDEKHLELSRMSSLLASVRDEKETIQAMAGARESSYERALKAQETKALEEIKEKDADFEKMKANLDALVQEKEDLLMLLKDRKKDADKAAEMIAVDMIAMQKAHSRPGTFTRLESQMIELATLGAERDRLHKELQAAQVSSGILSDLKLRLATANDAASAKDKIIFELKLALQRANDAVARETFEKDVFKADLEAKLKGASEELQSMEYKLDTMSREKDTCNMELRDELSETNKRLANLKAAEEKLVKLTQAKDTELEENKTKLDAIESKRVEVSAKLENQAAFSTELEAKLKETASELQETRFALDTMGCKKDALVADLRAELASAKANLKAVEENLFKLTLAKDMELEENKSKLDATESKRAELSAKLDNQAAFSAELEAKLKETVSELQETRFALDTMGCKKDALVADLRAELASAKANLTAAEENLFKLTLAKDMELEENKSKLDATESKRAELSAKLDNQAAFSAELEAKLEETASELQETRSALDTMGCKKDALVADLRAELASAKADLKAAEENLVKLILAKDMELEENKSKLDASESKQVELSIELDAQVALSACIRHELGQAEAVASQASETKDITIHDLTSELSQVKRDLSNIRLDKDAFERQASAELSSKDNIIHQLHNELSTLETNSSNALTISAALQERENEVRKLNQVRQDKVSLEDILSAARVSTTQYKAKVESMDAELNNARTQLQLVEAEKITLTAKLLEAIPAHPVPVSESVPVLLQGQQEARSQEAGDRDDVDVGTPDEGAHYQEGPDKMNVDETNSLTDRGVTPSAAPSSSLDSHIVDATVVSTPPRRSGPQLQRAKARISVAQRNGRHVITIPPHAHTNPSTRSPDRFIALDLRRSQQTMTSVEGLPAASHVEHSQPSFRPSTASAGLSGLRPRSTPTLGRGGSLMHGGVRSVRSVLRVPRSAHSNEGSGRVPGHVAP
ncbi:hypothetical protein E4T56_gene2255 [Termitomyces sp. T112]|nr:hypothetical protein E4T56_gene2255 [Termitomyces sp. T112]